MKTAYVFVPGINQLPSDHSWTDLAANWIVSQGDENKIARKLEYFSGPGLSRAFGQHDRAQRLQRIIRELTIDKWSIVIAVHSNGARVLCHALREEAEQIAQSQVKEKVWPQVRVIHLISPACDSDCEKSGLNKSTATIWFWLAGQDRALAVAATWIGRLFGYGSLGRTGPRNLAPQPAAKMHCINRPDFGHSEWFSKSQFAESMGRIWES